MVDRCDVIVLYLVFNVYLVLLHRYYGKSHQTKVLRTVVTSFCCSSDVWIPLPPTLSNLCVSNSHCIPAPSCRVCHFKHHYNCVGYLLPVWFPTCGDLWIFIFCEYVALHINCSLTDCCFPHCGYAQFWQGTYTHTHTRTHTYTRTDTHAHTYTRAHAHTHIHSLQPMANCSCE